MFTTNTKTSDHDMVQLELVLCGRLHGACDSRRIVAAARQMLTRTFLPNLTTMHGVIPPIWGFFLFFGAGYAGNFVRFSKRGLPMMIGGTGYGAYPRRTTGRS